MMRAKSLPFTLLLFLICGGCTLYQSSDREEFNSKGYLYQPKKTVAESQDCGFTTADQAMALTGLSPDEVRIQSYEGGSEVLIYKLLSDDKAAYCRLSFGGEYSEHELTAAAHTYIETFISNNSGL